MDTLIVYATHHGCTEKAVSSLKEKLGNKAQVFNAKTDTIPDLGKFDTVIVGGSIHAGRIQRGIKQFCAKHLEELLTKRLGLFLCCMYEGQQATSQFDGAYPEQLRNWATAKGLFGGAFDFDKMSFFERAIIKKVANVTKSVSSFNTDAIDEFVTAISD